MFLRKRIRYFLHSKPLLVEDSNPRTAKKATLIREGVLGARLSYRDDVRSALPAEPESDQPVASAHAELAKNVADVGMHGGGRDAEVRGDGLLRPVGEQERQHPAFCRGERRAGDERASST